MVEYAASVGEDHDGIMSKGSNKGSDRCVQPLAENWLPGHPTGGSRPANQQTRLRCVQSLS